MRHEYRTLWLSDIHLGTSASRAADLLAFLDKVSAEVIYLAGDIVDLERMKCRPVFPLLHQRVVGRFLQLASTGSRVIYVPGNHDMEFRLELLRWSADTVIAAPRPAAESLAA